MTTARSQTQQQRVKLRNGATTYDLGQCLGRGGFGICYEAIERRYASCCRRGGDATDGQEAEESDVVVSERTVAIKRVCMQQVRQASKEPHLWYEIGLHSQLRHRNVVELIDHFVFEENVYFVLEYCNNRSLADIVHNVKSLPLELAAYYFKQLIDGLQYLHDNSVFHRDLKLSNILVGADDTVKITDFGLACTFTRAYLERHIACGTPNYLSPEVLLRQGHTTKSDIWSCGVILYAMFGGVPPFQTETITAIYNNIVNCSYTFSSRYHTDENQKDLIAQILQLDSNERPSLGQIAGHPFCQYATTYKALLSKESNRAASCIGLRRSKSMRNLSKSLSNLFSKQSRTDLRKSTEKLFNRHVALPLSKSLTVVDLRIVRTTQLIDYFRGELAWQKRVTEFSSEWITWWRDCSNVCGLYYQLSNGFNCALYNDQTGCLRSTRTGRYYFVNLKAQRQLFHETQAESAERFFQPLVKDIDEAFKNVKTNSKLQEQLSWVSQSRSTGTPNYLVNWRNFSNGYYHVFHMRDQSVQVNFADWFILRICGQLCYFYQPAKKGFVVETADFQAWCSQDHNAELVEVLCSIFL
ncbi:hypothetical protein BOX15_Mlig031595g1 [Macrostomum lignano]|uniref:Protein kinase domain-containing protein n=1 Tax=Macrostomum lignano TaxID=282301 RepID=A0A267FFL1_9PLAT|nr:hypothetical protein BOX15_Mlig031595g1 [Macrostomum lignano]